MRKLKTTDEVKRMVEQSGYKGERIVPMHPMDQAWIDAPTDAERRRLEADYQRAAFDSVPLIPLGQYLPHAAWRKDISGMPRGSAPVFWNVKRG